MRTNTRVFESYVPLMNFLHNHIEKACVLNFCHSFQADPMKLSMHKSYEEEMSMTFRDSNIVSLVCIYPRPFEYMYTYKTNYTDKYKTILVHETLQAHTVQLHNIKQK